MILVTGANGHLGRATIRNLLLQADAKQLAISVREPEKATALAERGIAVRRGDYGDRAGLVRAFEGVHTLLLISGDAPVEVRKVQHRNAIDAAQESGVSHVVYTSVVDPDGRSPFTFAAIHEDTEAYLAASGLSYTFFRNGLYLEALPLMIGNPLESQKIYFPAGNGKIAFAGRDDIAGALANVLTAPAPHRNQAYTISLDAAWSFAEIAATLSKLSAIPIEYVNIPVAALEGELRKHGLPEFMVEAMTGMAKAVQENRLDQSGTTLESLLGRKPTGLVEFLAKTYLHDQTTA